MNAINLILRLAIVLVVFVSCKEMQKKQTVKEFISMNIDSLERTAFVIYESEPLKAIDMFRVVAEYYAINDNYQKSGQTNLNIAGIYDERLSEFSKALIYGRKSLKDWTTIEDSMQMANLYKYTGYLEGLNGNYEKAEEDIQTAIIIYEKLNFGHGIAVSNINMSKVQIFKLNFDRAKEYYQLSKDYWRANGVYSRIFDNNLVGIEIFQNTGQAEEVAKLIKENQLIMEDEEINSFLIDKFVKSIEESR